MKATIENYWDYHRVIMDIVHGCAFESFLELGIGTGMLAGSLRQHCTNLKTITGVDILVGDLPPEGVEWIREKRTDVFFKEDDRTWDCIFVDADHSYPQALRDVINSLKVLNDDGLLFMHDTYPPNVESVVPSLCGDVFKAYLELVERPDLEVLTLPLFNGLTLVRRVDKRRIWTFEASNRVGSSDVH
jgi:hypothetical protein